MTTENQLPHELARLGEALDRAVRADLAGRPRALRRLRHPRRVVVGAALTAILVPAAAIAATQLITTGQVAASLPQGTKALIGTNPTCAVVTANVEYHCVLAHAPGTGGPPPVGDGQSVTAPANSAGEAVVKLPDGTTGAVHTTSPPALADTDWKGTVEPSVDATKHVNGGCRALNSAGTEWECYIGAAAVRQSIISQGFLGQYAPSPGVG